MLDEILDPRFLNSSAHDVHMTWQEALSLIPAGLAATPTSPRGTGARAPAHSQASLKMKKWTHNSYMSKQCDLECANSYVHTVTFVTT